jgi:hypothetical protein
VPSSSKRRVFAIASKRIEFGLGVCEPNPVSDEFPQIRGTSLDKSCPSNHLNLLKNGVACKRSPSGETRPCRIGNSPICPESFALFALGVYRNLQNGNGCLAGEGGPLLPERRTPRMDRP